MSDRTLGLHVRARSGPGILHQLTGVIARHQGDITSVDIVERSQAGSRVYFEIELPGAPDALLAELRAQDAALEVEVVETFERVYGKRIIIVGGGAQVGQVAIGAISEADRHNIRGEHISVDTIPLVGEKPLPRRSGPSSACRAPRRWCSPARSWAGRSRRRFARCAPAACW